MSNTSSSEVPMSLEELYGVMERQGEVASPRTTINPYTSMISYYDLAHRKLVDIELDTECKLPYHTPVYACLSTEKTKCQFMDILLENFPKQLKQRVFSTKHSPTIYIHVLYKSSRGAKAMVALAETIIETISNWCDAMYYPVNSVDAFSKYMTEELQRKDKTLPHKCVFLKTCAFRLPSGEMSITGVPVVSTFEGSYVDPITKASSFTYRVDEAYSSSKDQQGLVLADSTTLYRYTTSMNDVISTINDPNSKVLFLFKSEELNKFVRKEIDSLFNDIQISPIAVLTPKEG